MTRPAQPEPYPGDLLRLPTGSGRLRREYRDPLGRPMRGFLTLTGATRIADDDEVIVAAPVNVQLDGGILEAVLPVGEYRVAGRLTTVDGFRADEDDTVTVR